MKEIKVGPRKVIIKVSANRVGYKRPPFFSLSHPSCSHWEANFYGERVAKVGEVIQSKSAAYRHSYGELLCAQEMSSYWACWAHNDRVNKHVNVFSGQNSGNLTTYLCLSLHSTNIDFFLCAKPLLPTHWRIHDFSNKQFFYFWRIRDLLNKPVLH